jgi:hypothetical protein
MFHEVPGVENRSVCLVDHQQTTQFAEGLREDQVRACVYLCACVCGTRREQ